MTIALALWNREGSRLKRFAQHAIVIFFLAITANAFLLTVFRIYFDFLPWWPTYLSYSAMAPYQGGGPSRTALAAEGQLQNGDWREIDLRPYFPLARGRLDIRMMEIGWLRLASGPSKTGDDSYDRKFRALAERLLEREAAEGRHYRAIRLSWDEWPSSPEGHDARYDERTRTPLVTWP